MNRIGLLTSMLVVACGGSGPQAFSWTSRAGLPVPRTGHAAVSLGGKLYVIGGFSGSTLARVEQYDPASNSWTRKADLHSARREFAAGAANGKIYVACGMSWSDPNAVTYVTTTEEYDPVADTWTERAPCPAVPAVNNIYGNAHIGGTSSNGRLYVAVATPSSAAMYEYDPVGNTWASKAAPPFGLGQYALAESGAQVYLLASQSNSANPGTTSKLAVYDPAGDFWILRAPLGGVWWAGLVASGGKLYTVGGVGVTGGFSPPAVRPTSVLSAVNQYDPTSNQWTSAGNFGAARHSLGAAVLGTDVYVTGGSSATSEFSPTPVTTVEAGAAPAR
jgi:N-acetylneuraminic acid mutarotase